MSDIAVEKTELVIKALDYAQKHNLNINNKDDVKKILDEVDPSLTSDENILEFTTLLQNADTFLEMTVTKNQSKKENLPN